MTNGLSTFQPALASAMCYTVLIMLPDYSDLTMHITQIINFWQPHADQHDTLRFMSKPQLECTRTSSLETGVQQLRIAPEFYSSYTDDLE